MKTIAFCGAGGTGKSTVAEYLGSNIPSPVDYLRHAFYGKDAKYGEFTKFSDIAEWQYRILFAQVALEEYNRHVNGNTDFKVPIERSSIDYAAYMLNQTERFSRNKKSMAQIQDYVTWCVSYANSNYDYIVYFPVGKFKPADSSGSAKERDEQSIRKTDNYIKGLLEKIKIPVLRLQPTDVKERADAIWKFCS